MYSVAITFLLFILYSFAGWIIEVLNSIIRHHKFVNRGFLIGPLCPIYGFAGLAAAGILGKYEHDPIALFFSSIALFSILEYFTSFIMEKLFHARWWDYSYMHFNINGRICLETMIPFGLLGVIVISIINPMAVGMLQTIPPIIAYIISTILAIIFIADIIISLIVIVKYGKTVSYLYPDSTEEINKIIRTKFLEGNIFKRRLIKAFPTASPSPKIPKDKN
jgi:uncharacterized membrane protein